MLITGVTLVGAIVYSRGSPRKEYLFEFVHNGQTDCNGWSKITFITSNQLLTRCPSSILSTWCLGTVSEIVQLGVDEGAIIGSTLRSVETVVTSVGIRLINIMFLTILVVLVADHHWKWNGSLRTILMGAKDSSQ